MKNFENVVLIYPEDPSIDFLQPLYDSLLILFPYCKVHRVEFGDSLHSKIDDDTDLVIFLGHGTSSGLFSGVNEKGEKKLLCDIPKGAFFLSDCAVVLFSCNSDEYLGKLQKELQKNSSQITNYIVFGDMPTDWVHITHNQGEFPHFWNMCTDDQLDYYRSALVDAVISGFEKAIKTNSFYGFYKGVSYTVNVKINDIVRQRKWTKEQKLQLIERLVEFRKEIEYNEVASQ